MAAETMVRAVCRVYRLMLYGYPGEFRELYGADMLQTFRDRARDVSRRGGWARFALHVTGDWLTTVLHERCSAMRTISIPAVRVLMLLGVAIDLALLFFRFASPRHDVFHGDAETSFAVLLMYGLLVLWATTNTDPAHRVALDRGTRLGLISGAVFIVHTRYGDYIRLSDAAMNALGVAGLCAVFLLWGAAGYQTARRTGTAGGALLAGSWCGVVCVLAKVTFAYLMLLTPGPNPDFLATWRLFQITSGPALGAHAWMVRQTLNAGGLHLLVGPVFGAILGGVGGVLARFRGKPAAALETQSA